LPQVKLFDLIFHAFFGSDSYDYGFHALSLHWQRLIAAMRCL